MTGLARPREFIAAVTRLVDQKPEETELLKQGEPLLQKLIAVDDWLPEPFAAPDATRYQQYLLHCDPLERFSVVSFVWGPGQQTPIHNHTVWGLIGVLRGAEIDQPYRVRKDGGLEPFGQSVRLDRGSVAAVSPTIGDIHRVRNAFEDRVSISIHLYGANIGAVRRAVFDSAGATKPFVSGYSSPVQPNLWDRSIETRAGA